MKIPTQKGERSHANVQKCSINEEGINFVDRIIWLKKGEKSCVQTVLCNQYVLNLPNQGRQSPNAVAIMYLLIDYTKRYIKGMCRTCALKPPIKLISKLTPVIKTYGHIKSLKSIFTVRDRVTFRHYNTKIFKWMVNICFHHRLVGSDNFCTVIEN